MAGRVLSKPRAPVVPVTNAMVGAELGRRLLTNSRVPVDPVVGGAIEVGVAQPRALSHVWELVAAGTRDIPPTEAPASENRRVVAVRFAWAARRTSLAASNVAQQNVTSCSLVRSRVSSARWQTRRGWMLSPVMLSAVTCWGRNGENRLGREGYRGRGGRVLVGLRVAERRSSSGNSSKLYVSKLYGSNIGVSRYVASATSAESGYRPQKVSRWKGDRLAGLQCPCVY